MQMERLEPKTFWHSSFDTMLAYHLSKELKLFGNWPMAKPCMENTETSFTHCLVIPGQMETLVYKQDIKNSSQGSTMSIVIFVLFLSVVF